VFDNAVVLDQTPFYALSGGQVCDHGTIQGVEVTDVVKMPNGQHIHFLLENTFKVGDVVEAIVNKEYRDAIRKNHSSAHLFQAALQSVLGSHVHQQGSLDAAEFMRFDFNNYNNLTDEEILKVEDEVNAWIKEGHEVVTEVLPLEEAKKKHAMMLFDDKYGDTVRVVEMGVSTEFCGGTHVSNTKEIEDFEIVSIESIGSGIFRGTALTGKDAFENLQESLVNKRNELNTLLAKANSIVSEAKQKGIDLAFKDDFDMSNVRGYRFVLKFNEHIAYVSNLVKELDKEFNNKLSQQALSNLDSYKDQIEGNALFVSEKDKDTNVLKDLASALLNKYALEVVFVSNVSGDKVTFVCASKGNINAGQLVKAAATVCGGNGGGKPTMAQAGGKDSTKIAEAISAVKELVK
jgi:alanyl-tRNA synthetase